MAPQLSRKGVEKGLGNLGNGLTFTTSHIPPQQATWGGAGDGSILLTEINEGCCDFVGWHDGTYYNCEIPDDCD